MGLDMYLEGHKYLWQDWDHPERDRREEGYRITNITVELGYWRKHPNLHGYIVQHFAGGKDECQEITLEADDLRQIIRAVQDGGLPETQGFFFGKSELTQEERNH